MLRHELKGYLSLILTVGLFLTLCCGGNGSDGGVIPPSLVASFSPEKADPDAMDVSLQPNSRSGDTFTVDVVITGDVPGVYSASFYLIYDGTLLDYLNYTEGTFLNKDGELTSFMVSEEPEGLIVGATRLGQVGGVNAIGNEILMRIAFRVKKTGVTDVYFDIEPPPPDGKSNLLDSNAVVIQGIEWFGGTASGS